MTSTEAARIPNLRPLISRGFRKETEAVRQLHQLSRDQGILVEDKHLIPKNLIPLVMEVLQWNGIDPDKYYRKSTRHAPEPRYKQGGPIYDSATKWWEYRK
jgi:hypothetical protein